MGCFHALTHCFQNLRAFVIQHLVMGCTHRLHQPIQFRNALVVELLPKRWHCDDKPNLVQGIVCRRILRNAVQIRLHLVFQPCSIIKGADLTLEEGFYIAHGILLIKEVVLFLEQIVDQRDVVLLLVQHFLRCSNSVVHYCLIRVLVDIIVLLVQFVIMLQLVSELIGNKFNQTIFVRWNIHDIEIIPQEIPHSLHFGCRHNHTLADGDLTHLTLFAEHIR